MRFVFPKFVFPEWNILILILNLIIFCIPSIFFCRDLYLKTSLKKKRFGGGGGGVEGDKPLILLYGRIWYVAGNFNETVFVEEI